MKIGKRLLKPGDLIKFRDYVHETDHYGLYLGPIYNKADPEVTARLPWGDIYVWGAKGEEEWISWQCEVVNESRGHGTS